MVRIHELENVLGHACMMTDGDMVDAGDLPEYPTGSPAAEPPDCEDMLSLPEVHRRHALRVLERVEGNKARAAKILGIHRATLYRLGGKAGLDAESERPDDGTP